MLRRQKELDLASECLKPSYYSVYYQYINHCSKRSLKMTRRLPFWKVCKRDRASVNGRHTQGVSFLSKMAYEKVRGRTSAAQY